MADMVLRDTDLPASMRKQLGLPPATAVRPAGRSVTRGGRWVCAACRDPFTTWVSVQRHSTETGHRRYDIPLSPPR